MFATAASDRLAVLENLTDFVALWDSFKHETLGAAQESNGEYLKASQNFILLETLEATGACCAVPKCLGLRHCRKGTRNNSSGILGRRLNPIS